MCVDCFYQPFPQTTAAMPFENVNVTEVSERRTIRHNACKADLQVTREQAEAQGCLNGPANDVSRDSLSPVRTRQVGVHSVNIYRPRVRQDLVAKSVFFSRAHAQLC